MRGPELTKLAAERLGVPLHEFNVFRSMCFPSDHFDIVEASKATQKIR